MDRLCRVAKHWDWKFPMSSIAVAWLVILTLPNVIVDAASEFFAREIQISPEMARKGWDYYTSNRIWHPNLELNGDGMKLALEILAEETKSSPQDATKYIDRSYLLQALKEL